MKRIFFLVALLLTVAGLQAQEYDLGKAFKKDKDAQKEMADGEEQYEAENYLLALPHYRALEAKYGEAVFLQYRIGICLLYKSDETEQAFSYLSAVKKKNPKAADIDYYIGRAQHINNSFDEAIASFEAYKLNKRARPDLKKQADRYIEYCKNGKELAAAPITVNLRNIGPPVNTDASEYVPVLSSDEQVMLFTYRGELSRGGLQIQPGRPDENGEYFEDIFISYKDSTRTWGKPEPLDSNINSLGHDACIAISNDGQTLIVFKNSEEQGDVGDIYFSHLDGTRWSTPVRLTGDVNTSAWEGSASLSADEKTLYFASERGGGYGGRDIWKATLMPDGTWGNVKNLGDRINTPYDDDAPFIHPNGTTLLFSSQGHKSMGGYDIFRSDINPNDSSWTEPENIGYPINTAGDDKYFVLSTDGKRGYYSSGKAGGFGQQDIYLCESDFALKDANVIMITGVVTLDDKPVAAQITISSDGKPLDRYNLKSNIATGKYLVNLRQGANYELTYEIPNMPKESRLVTATGGSGAIIQSTIDVHFETDAHKVYRLQREKIFRDSVLRLDSLNKLAGNPPLPKDTLKKDTTVKVIPPAVFDYNDVLTKFGAVTVQGLEFRVQVAAYNLPQNYRYNSLTALGPIENQKLDDGITRFTMGHYTTLNDADALRKKILGMGTPDAFVTAVYQGKRYLIRDLVAQNFFQP